MQCCHCGAKQELGLGEKVSFRQECMQCGQSLHSCLNCKYYQVGLPNDCRVPGTERILDRSAMNFCEEFSPSHEMRDKKNAWEEQKKAFESLFKELG